MQCGDTDADAAVFLPGSSDLAESPVGTLPQESFQRLSLVGIEGRFSAGQRFGGQAALLFVQADETLDAGQGDAEALGNGRLSLPFLNRLHDALAKVNRVSAHGKTVMQLQCQKETL